MYIFENSSQFLNKILWKIILNFKTFFGIKFILKYKYIVHNCLSIIVFKWTHLARCFAIVGPQLPIAQR